MEQKFDSLIFNIHYKIIDYGKIVRRKIIETKMRIKDLYQALRKLNDEELKVIDSLYFKKMTIRDLAKEQKVSSKKIFSFRNKI